MAGGAGATRELSPLFRERALPISRTALLFLLFSCPAVRAEPFAFGLGLEAHALEMEPLVLALRGQRGKGSMGLGGRAGLAEALDDMS